MGNVRKFIIALVTKVIDKSPLKFSLARNMTWLDPVVTSVSAKADVEGGENQKSIPNVRKLFENCVTVLVSAKRFPAEDVDKACCEFKDLIRDAGTWVFDENKDRLDSFWYGVLANNSSYGLVWRVAKTLLLLSHGQASVERGFSVNKELSTVNMAQKTLVAQRHITDHLSHVGGVLKVELSKKLLISAACSRQKYVAHLAEEKEKDLKAKRVEKRKRDMEEVDGLKERKKRATELKECLDKQANQAYDAMEKTNKAKEMRDLAAKGNALRKSSSDKQAEIEDLEKLIHSKLENIANN